MYLLIVGALIVVVVLTFVLRRWKSGELSQNDLSRPLPLPPHEATFDVDIPGEYIGASHDGNWLDQIVTHGFGVRSRAAFNVGRVGIWIERVHAKSFFIPATEVTRVRIDRQVSLGSRTKENMIVVTFTLGSALVDFGFLADGDEGIDKIVQACVKAGFNVDVEAITKEQS